MLKKRIVPCLDIANGRTVKGTNFVNLRDAGDPVELAVRYVDEGADELVFLDITATVEGRATFASLVERIAEAINIPFTVGGGVGSVDHVTTLLEAGADKVSVNSSAVRRPELISELALAFGSQCIVVAVDAGLIDDKWHVFTHGGRRATDIPALQWIQRIEELGGGELLLTSMQHDGTKSGFATELLQEVCGLINIPVIASGGAGSVQHFIDVFTETDADAALAASVFHFGEIPIPELKANLKQHKIPVR